MNGDQIPREGHAGPTRVWILNARGYATMTGASCGFFRGRCESRKANRLPWRQSGSTPLHGRTGRNMAPLRGASPLIDSARGRRALANEFIEKMGNAGDAIADK